MYAESNKSIVQVSSTCTFMNVLVTCITHKNTVFASAHRVLGSLHLVSKHGMGGGERCKKKSIEEKEREGDGSKRNHESDVR